MASTLFGRSADFENAEIVPTFDALIAPSSELFDSSRSGPPMQEPVFGTHYWCQQLSDSLIEEWTRLSQPQLPPDGSSLALPMRNPFIPVQFELKELPTADCDHPLLNCSIKLQVHLGKRKVRYLMWIGGSFSVWLTVSFSSAMATGNGYTVRWRQECSSPFL